MISVDVTTAFFIYLGISLSGVLVSWVLFEYRKKIWRFNPLEKIIFRCKICTHSYMIEKGIPYSRCPQCKCMNDIG